MEPKPGDIVEVKTDSQEFRGVLVQSPESEQDTLVLKLESGYNIGISREKIRSIHVVEHFKEKEAKHEKAKQAQNLKGLPKITILHTGGTIASKVDYRTGGVVARFSPQEILEMFPELADIANIDSRLIRNMWSEDMRFAHYNMLAKEAAEEEKKGVDGIIITHGTDTMHYSSAALAFALQGIGIPVVIVGSQRSSDRGSTDSALNLVSAAYFIANSDFSGVAICMHESINDTSCLILPPAKTRKMHASRRDAFRPINSKPIARVNVEEKEIKFMGEYKRKDKSRKAGVKLFKEKIKVGILKAHPNMFPEEIQAYKGFDGLVIEGFALGHFPIDQIDEFTSENKKNLEAIRELCREMPVVMTSQAIYGRLQMSVYASGRDLREAGVLGHLSDMTPETAFIKLAWLLSNYSKEETKELISKDLIGEISERTEEESFLN